MLTGVTVSIALDADRWEALDGSCEEAYNDAAGYHWPEPLHRATPAQCEELAEVVSSVDEQVPRSLHTHLAALRGRDHQQLTDERSLELETLACHLHVRPGEQEHAWLTDSEGRALLPVLARTHAVFCWGLPHDDGFDRYEALAQRDRIAGTADPLTEPCLVMSTEAFRALWWCVVTLDIRSRDRIGRQLPAGEVDECLESLRDSHITAEAVRVPERGHARLLADLPERLPPELRGAPGSAMARARRELARYR